MEELISDYKNNNDINRDKALLCIENIWSAPFFVQYLKKDDEIRKQFTYVDTKGKRVSLTKDIIKNALTKKNHHYPIIEYIFHSVLKKSNDRLLDLPNVPFFMGIVFLNAIDMGSVKSTNKAMYNALHKYGIDKYLPLEKLSVKHLQSVYDFRMAVKSTYLTLLTDHLKQKTQFKTNAKIIVESVIKDTKVHKQLCTFLDIFINISQEDNEMYFKCIGKHVDIRELRKQIGAYDYSLFLREYMHLNGDLVSLYKLSYIPSLSFIHILDVMDETESPLDAMVVKYYLFGDINQKLGLVEFDDELNTTPLFSMKTKNPFSADKKSYTLFKDRKRIIRSNKPESMSERDSEEEMMTNTTRGYIQNIFSRLDELYSESTRNVNSLEFVVKYNFIKYFIKDWDFLLE